MERYDVLVSRFSWPHSYWSNKSVGEYEAWLIHRLHLFEKYTILSIKNLVVKPSLWVIMVGVHEKHFMDLLEGALLKASVPYKFIIFNNKPLHLSLQNALSDFPTPCEIWSSRLDTDDLIASDYFARLRGVNLSKENLFEGCAISFPGGSIFCEDTNLFYYSAYPDNPFLTYAEIMMEPGKISTVFFGMHTELMEKSKHSKNLRSYHPMWCTVIHAENLANRSLIDTCELSLGESMPLRTRFGL